MSTTPQPNENISQEIELINPVKPENEDGEFDEFRDLFIQGRALNAEQIEALDQNLLEMSLCQNHPPQTELDENSILNMDGANTTNLD